MQFKNTHNSYGLVARVLHWAMAAVIFAMFALGWWMVDLDLYNSWYKTAPYIHESIGVILAIVLVGRWVWRLTNTNPDDSYLRPIEQRMSYLMHLVFYVLMVAIMIFGYLISTVDGRPIDVFGLFSLPSVYQQKGLEDLVGFIHEILAYTIIALAIVHTLAALKHHFIDRDVTLIRMWKSHRDPE